MRGGGAGILGGLALALEAAVFWGKFCPPVHEMVMASSTSLDVANGDIWTHVLAVSRL